ncbi:hypothetical protein AAFF_G00354230 [Aldrovandia affinis]|uniref:Transmembrane protein 44 n=1 Tax=Aldrovandia affinis TaxID=143900 RepID=A0AAD7SKJ3_9TELE|nr:hypothetical protein AAFF_G00354230 [Aldrovandia affinis]
MRKLVCKRCGAKERNVGDAAACALYCFLGNLSSAVGALLSNQLVIQVFMGVFIAALDVVHFVFIMVPFCLWWHLKTGGIFMWPSVQRWLAEGAQPKRCLLSLILQDDSEILGYALGLLSFVIGWTSKFPPLRKARQGKMSSVAHVSSGVVCALANVLYGSAILIYDTHLKSVLRVLPWLLNSFGCAVFDVVILGLSCYSRATSQLGPRAGEPADNQPLLKSTSNQPVCVKEVTTWRQTQCASQPPRRSERVVWLDKPCSSDSVSSSLGSRLEVRPQCVN